eukprot:m.220193 g.220193  ORF g.220193 m.220193 type:complete len:65 (+) comp15920_c0_seq4:5266-5460(+)
MNLNSIEVATFIESLVLNSCCRTMSIVLVISSCLVIKLLFKTEAYSKNVYYNNNLQIATLKTKN